MYDFTKHSQLDVELLKKTDLCFDALIQSLHNASTRVDATLIFIGRDVDSPDYDPSCIYYQPNAGYLIPQSYYSSLQNNILIRPVIKLKIV